MVAKHKTFDRRNDDVFNSQLQKLKERLEILPDKPEETSETALYTLWHFASGHPLSCQVARDKTLSSLSSEQLDLLKHLVEKRLGGMPLAYIVGRQSFMGLEMLSDESALIPRKETELLAEVCLESIENAVNARGTANVIDVFTGSGNLPLCFKHKAPMANVFGLDLSKNAITLAKKNSEWLKIPVHFRESDMFSVFEDDEYSEYFDVISGAPPYICAAKVGTMADEISKHEPSMAFEAGPFGVKFFNKMIKASPRLLRHRGMLIFEVGLGQGDGLAKRLRKNINYNDVQLIKDAKGAVRVLSARRI